MIFVTVGTHEQPFDRLARAVDELKKNGVIREEVVLQTGFCTYEPKYCRAVKTLPYAEMQDLVKKARIVITHGGPSSFMMALREGKIPVVVPRQEKFGEHVNDHQVRFCEAVAKEYHCLILVEDIEKLGETITHYDEIAGRLLRENAGEAVPAKDAGATLLWEGHNHAFMQQFIPMAESLAGPDPKICLVGSSGGHLMHLYLLREYWEKHEHFWVTFDKPDARGLLGGERMIGCYYPTNRSLKALLINTRLAWKTLRKEKPDLIISSGAAVAVPFFWLGKLFGAKTMYVEVFDRIDASTVTGKLVRPVTDRFIVQWESMKKVYRNAVNLGSIY